MSVRDRESIPYSDVTEGREVEISWESMSGKGGRATGTVTRVRRGGVADPDGLNQFTIRVDDNTRYRVYPDAGEYEGGRTNAPVERMGDDSLGGVSNVGYLVGIYEPED